MVSSSAGERCDAELLEDAMRRAICAVAVALLVSPGGSLAAAQEDESPQDGALAEALWRIAVATHTRVGFQDWLDSTHPTEQEHQS